MYNIIIIYYDINSQSIITIDCGVFPLNNEPIKIKKKADDGHRVISLRIREDILSELDRLANASNRSRNEIIHTILEHGIKNIEIE